MRRGSLRYNKFAYKSSNSGLISKLYELNWVLPALIIVIGVVGVFMIYAATDGIWSDGALQHAVRIMLASLLMIAIALTNIRVWYELSYPIYAIALILLIGVELFGVNVNGSQRWLDIGPMRLQPSEIMKPAIVLALARYYHDLSSWRVSSALGVFGALIIIVMPMALIFNQPDLGTTLLLAATGFLLIFLAGINLRIVALSVFGAMIAIPMFFAFGLKAYQRARIMTFFDPTRDPSGASYHITQSKIALGSGGVSGKGFMKGTQRQGEYVPENRTDFIFTVLGEEFGFIGSILMMGLYIAVITLCIWLSWQCRSIFSKLLILGLTTTFTLYIFINLGMVMGLAPVVGVPLPLISYGGTVILAVMGGFGLILSAHLHRTYDLPRSTD